MDLYVLDDQLRRIQVVDTFESFIWTERFSEYGDFQLVIESTAPTRKVLTIGTHVAIETSYRVMTIETVEKKRDAEGRSILEITGRSLEALMLDRVAKKTMDDLTVDYEWILEGTPREIMKEVFKEICILGKLDSSDIIPFIQEGDFLVTVGSWYSLPTNLVWEQVQGVWQDFYSAYDPDDGEDPSEDVMVSIKPQPLYDIIKDLCDVYGLGFRIVKNFDKSELYFEVYRGNDRTSLQMGLPPVLFSVDLDNLVDSSEYHSVMESKNVAYVFSNYLTEIVFAEGDGAASGFERRILYVDATDTEVPEREYNLTTDQHNAINAALNIAPSPEHKSALQSLANRHRLTAEEVTLTLFFTTTTLISAAQRTQITNARNTNIAYNSVEDAYVAPLLRQRGQIELAKNKKLSAFDGEISRFGGYKYGVDYDLGDIVELRDTDGILSRMRVTEQIFVHDIEGEKSYPTLVADSVVEPGSWGGQPPYLVWDDATGTWIEA